VKRKHRLRIFALSGLAIPILLIGMGTASAVLSTDILNATSALGLPAWVTRLTERHSVAYPAHAALGTVLDGLRLSPSATAVQWFKAAAHARSKTDLDRAAQGIAAALERDADGEALRTLCGIQDLGNAQQVRAAVWAGTWCDRWTPKVALEASVAPVRASAGFTVSIVASVTSATSVSGLVDLEIHDSDVRTVAQWVIPDEDFVAEQRHDYPVTWVVPSDLPPGEYVVKLGVFRHGWTMLHGWKNSAATLTIAP
jgi:hypothetical protein